MYVSAGGQTAGPFDLNEIFAQIGSGRINPADEIWIEGTDEAFPALDLLPAACFGTADQSSMEMGPILAREMSHPADNTPGPMSSIGMVVAAGFLWLILPILAHLMIVFLLVVYMFINWH